MVRAQARGSRQGAAVVVAVALVLLTGCQEPAGPGANAAGPARAVAQKAPPAAITVEPAPYLVRVRPDAPVTVTASNGTLTDVTLTDGKGRPVEGALSGDGSSWKASARLRLNSRYTVQARAVNPDGVAADHTSQFTTLKPKKRLTTSISPLDGSTVGVGMPIAVRLSHPVRKRAEVEKALTVTSSKAIEGSWSWLSDEELHFRPREYWPAGSKVTLKVRLQDVDAGRGVWGGENRTIKFRIGSSMVSVVDVDRLRMTVYRNGKVARVIPVSTGKAGFLTRNGIKVISEKHQLKVMDATTIGISRSDPEYYRLDVPYALRVTNSGEFVHAAPWSVADQGRARVSHGCVGMSTANAIWLYNQTHVGDIVQVVGSPRKLEPGNGWTDWNVTWSTWVKGSAL
jgi:lipoprotein-anchoring transpeptidase ErfK/SrfK